MSTQQQDKQQPDIRITPVHNTIVETEHARGCPKTDDAQLAENHLPVDQMNHPNAEDEDPPNDYSPDGKILYEPAPYGMDDLENVQKYNKGGYHPVQLGDMLNCRYEVVHKLGSGGFGIVWLCLDIVHKAWRAVKILTADESATTLEPQIYAHLLNQASGEEIRKNHILIPFSQFWIEGPNGRHLCLVLPVVGGQVDYWTSLQPFHEDEKQMDQQLVRTKPVCRQIVQSVRFLHKNGVCHGDLKPQNVLMRLNGMDRLDKSQVLELLGQPIQINVRRRSGAPAGSRAPKYIIRPPQDWWWEKMLSDSIALIDFGTSFFTNSEHKSDIMTRLYAAPECHFTNCWAPGPYSDIWSLGWTLFEISAGDYPPLGSFNESLNYLPRDLERYLGPLPEPFRGEWYNMLDHAGLAEVDDDSEYDDEDTQIGLDSDPSKAQTLEPASYTSAQFLRYTRQLIGNTGYASTLEAKIGRERFRSLDDKDNPDKDYNVEFRYPRDQVIQFSSLLRLMFVYNPLERANIDQVWQHIWLRESFEDSPKPTRGLRNIMPSGYTLLFVYISLPFVLYCLILVFWSAPLSAPLLNFHPIRIKHASDGMYNPVQCHCGMKRM
ncbi:kinase-like domain-containing protein [Xylariaceae sp. FL1272]|nr:kinase-like domain-containing protein [Xylariaceae sp. FL1272]